MLENSHTAGHEKPVISLVNRIASSPIFQTRAEAEADSNADTFLHANVQKPRSGGVYLP